MEQYEPSIANADSEPDLASNSDLEAISINRMESSAISEYAYGTDRKEKNDADWELDTPIDSTYDFNKKARRAIQENNSAALERYIGLLTDDAGCAVLHLTQPEKYGNKCSLAGLAFEYGSIDCLDFIVNKYGSPYLCSHDFAWAAHRKSLSSFEWLHSRYPSIEICDDEINHIYESACMHDIKFVKRIHELYPTLPMKVSHLRQAYGNANKELIVWFIANAIVCGFVKTVYKGKRDTHILPDTPYCFSHISSGMYSDKRGNNINKHIALFEWMLTMPEWFEFNINIAMAGAITGGSRAMCEWISTLATKMKLPIIIKFHDIRQAVEMDFDDVINWLLQEHRAIMDTHAKKCIYYSTKKVRAILLRSYPELTELFIRERSTRDFLRDLFPTGNVYNDVNTELLAQQSE